MWICCEWPSCVPRAAVDFRVGISLQFLPPPLFIHHCWFAPAEATSPLHAPTPSPALLGLPALLECCADTTPCVYCVVTHRSSSSGPELGPGVSVCLRHGFRCAQVYCSVETPTACLIPASQTGLPPPARQRVILKSILTSNHQASAYLTHPFVS